MISFLFVSSILMMLLSTALLSTILVVDASSLAATTDMVWSDEFTTLERKNWNIATSEAFVPAAGVQTFMTDHVSISDDEYLSITTDKSSSGAFESGQVDTYNKVHFQYCTITARIKIPNTTTGLVPTFYTQGVNTAKPWPHNGEIDIMKVGQGNASASGSGNERMISGIHYITAEENFYSNTGSRDCGTDLSNNYFLYTLDWTPTTITTFYNDRQVWTADISSCSDDDDCTEFHQPHYMLFHTSVGGSFPSNACPKLGASSASGGTIPNVCSPNDQLSASEITAKLPATMSVDWVRIYDNGSCQLTVVDNDGGTSVPNTPVMAPIESDTGASVPLPVGSTTGGSGGAPTGSVTAPGGGSSPTTSDSGVKYTFPPNLSPIDSDSGTSPGLSPTGSDSGSSSGQPPTSSGSGSSSGLSPTSSGSGGSSGLSPTGSDSGGSSGLPPTGSNPGGSSGLSPTGSDTGGSSGLSPTSSVNSPAGSAPVPIVSIPIPPTPVSLPVPIMPQPVPVMPQPVPIMPQPVPVVPQAVPVLVVAPSITSPTVAVVQPRPSDSKTGKGKKKCKEKKTVSPPGVVAGDSTGKGKGGEDSGVVSGDDTNASGKGKGGTSSNSGSSVVTGDNNSSNSTRFAPSPSATTSGDNVEGTSNDYRSRQQRRRAGRVVKDSARRRAQITTPNSVGGGNSVNTTDPGVVSGDATDDEEECEEVEADALSVDSSSRSTTTWWTSLILVVTWIAYVCVN